MTIEFSIFISTLIPMIFFLSLSMCSRCCFFIRCFVFFVCNIGVLSVRHQHIIIRYFVLFRAYFDMHCSLTAKHTNQFIVAPGFEIYIPMFFFPLVPFIFIRAVVVHHSIANLFESRRGMRASVDDDGGILQSLCKLKNKFRNAENNDSQRKSCDSVADATRFSFFRFQSQRAMYARKLSVIGCLLSIYLVHRTIDDTQNCVYLLCDACSYTFCSLFQSSQKTFFFLVNRFHRIFFASLHPNELDCYVHTNPIGEINELT